ncbi:hypothetical protein BDV27DRAFT_164775 [Aspergillus caelatus]|uniref:NADP-dependent oxidoreductase domain-containing protein n=1 Tax=Aspergillus caelatus TaxID=61420 RepID=A0A5N6ZJM1_9EURO|nr:uncharacterized protein BDV27DRAFT_164775 [Aspergillus caelatus]KAE8357166.1 hypothetical protein BDV27DRAFT_164775 [Aspergillus caelatus]
MAAATLLREVPGGCTQSDPLRACLLRRRHADPGPPPSAEQQQGLGFLTGHVTKLEDIPQGDIRHLFGRFQPEVFFTSPLLSPSQPPSSSFSIDTDGCDRTSTKTWELVEKINTFAKQRGATSAQLALAWIRAHSNTDNCGTIIPIPGATVQSRVEENCQVVEISAEEKNRLDEIIKSIEVVGERQIVGMSDKHL